MGKERRQHKRVPVTIPVEIFVSGETSSIRGEVTNLSETGAHVRCKRNLKPGMKLLLQLQIPEATMLRGEITEYKRFKDLPREGASENTVMRWIKSLEHDGFGVRFSDLSPATKEFVVNLVKYLEKKVEEKEDKEDKESA